VSDALALRKSGQPKNLSHRDVFVIACPINRRSDHNGLRLFVLNHNRVAARFGYNVRFLPVGPEDSAVGSPTQMGIFEQTSTNPSQ